MSKLLLPPVAREALGEIEAPTTPAQVLAALIKLLAAPTRRAVGAFAYDAEGELTDPDAAAACAWCVLGGLQLLAPPEGETSESESPLWDATVAVIEVETGYDVANWTDRRTHGQVMAMLKRAHSRALASEGVARCS